MADERVPAFSAGARMHPVHPDDVRIAEGRDRASRGRRKVRGVTLPSNPCKDMPTANSKRRRALSLPPRLYYALG